MIFEVRCWLILWHSFPSIYSCRIRRAQRRPQDDCSWGSRKLQVFTIKLLLLLFCLFLLIFVLFENILQKNCRLHQDSNSDWQNRRRARWPLDHHHGPSSNHIIFRSIEMPTLASSWSVPWILMAAKKNLRAVVLVVAQ